MVRVLGEGSKTEPFSLKKFVKKSFGKISYKYSI
tara:strand:+ start:720 stop:821 length:102 start_codon:yes stop_codon:yes gene_type:complete